MEARRQARVGVRCVRVCRGPTRTHAVCTRKPCAAHKERHSMILTQCATCAAPLPRLAKQCSRCQTRYCGPACQKTHWEEGGHDKLCKKIKRGGGAEQYCAEKSYTKAVAIAAEACVEDTKGQTCYICTEAVHRHTKEGLVRGCACHTTEGFVHVSCLAEQAKFLREEAEENNLDGTARDARRKRWYTCGLCKQQYHGVVSCAFGWACWKIYVDRPETDWARQAAIGILGNGLSDAKYHEAALTVREAELSMERRVGTSESNMLVLQSNLASTYQKLGRDQQAQRMMRDVYSGRLKLNGEEHELTLIAATNYASSLIHLSDGRFKEARSLLRKTMPVARRVVGECDDITLKMRWNYANALYLGDGATLGDLREAVTTLETTTWIMQRDLGGAHPHVAGIERTLKAAQAALGAREASVPGDVRAICEAVAAMTPGDT